jgi:hypothetical protein
MERFSGSEAAGGTVSLAFRWLGVAGVELTAGNQVLALDPFFTRPGLVQLLRPLQPDRLLAAARLPACQVVLVTHPHYDHLLDVPAVLQHTGAVAYGSPNTCRLLRLLGVPDTQVKQVQVGDQLALGAFQVEVIAGQHAPLPFGRLFNGNLRPGLEPPLHAWDYRMDACLGYCITVMGQRLLLCAKQPQPVDILFAGAQETLGYYQRLFLGTRPHTFIPIHWDNFTRPLSRPLRRLTRPGGLALWQVTRLARQLLPHVNVIIPEIFREYTSLS